jgi:Asp/Glu/hydantoin racemase
MAALLGRKAGLVTVNPAFIPYHEDQIARRGLAERIVAVRAVEAQVADYTARSAIRNSTGKCARSSSAMRGLCSILASM